MADRDATVVAPKKTTCGTMPAHVRLLENNPAFRSAQMRLQDATSRRKDGGQALRELNIVVVKTNVHVVYCNTEQNISREQIESQIAVLNQDFRAANPDAGQTPAVWRDLVADPRIQFELDTITRTKSTKTAFTTDDAIKKPSTGGIAPIAPTTHLNVWVGPLGRGLLGYAQFPGGPIATDGIVICCDAFGTNGTASAPFNRGRTGTHQVGHYFNLRHIWGDTPDCSGSDMCADTPNCIGPNFGTPVFPHVTCNNGPDGDMFMNYMDRTDDTAMFMFTPHQVLRMRTALDTTRRGLA